MVRHAWTAAIMLMVIGGAGTFAGLGERSLARASSSLPEEISLRDLIARGADGNPNVIVTDFTPCQNYIFKTRNMMWEGAWVPVVPGRGAGVQAGRPNNVQAIIYSNTAGNENELYQRCGQRRLRGLVTNRIVSLGSEEAALLRQSYPGTDFSRCLIIHEGREPAGTAKMLILIAGGLVLLFAGLSLAAFLGAKWFQERSSAQNEDDDRPRRRRRAARAEDDLEPAPKRRGPRREEERPRRREVRSARDDDDDIEPAPKRRRTRDD